MSKFISLLRGINVGGNKKIKMDELKTLYETLGFTHVKTLLQSGNVVFESTIIDPATLVQQIESAILGRFGFESKIIVRTAVQMADVLTRHPFSPEQLTEPSKILVTFLRDTPTPELIEAMVDSYIGSEKLYVSGQECYVYFPDGMGRTKMDNHLIERRLKTTGTGRNWNTVNKLVILSTDS